MWGWTCLQWLLILGMPHPRACPFNIYLFFMHINQVFSHIFGLWCRWQYIWMKETHLMNTENCFKNSLVIAIMFRVTLGDWGKQYKIPPGNMYNIVLYIYKLATKAPSLMHAGYGYWWAVEKLAASLCWHNVIYQHVMENRCTKHSFTFQVQTSTMAWLNIYSQSHRESYQVWV